MNDRLNDLLIDLGKSLLQYSQDVWPWTTRQESTGVRDALDHLATQQRHSVALLAELLDARGHSVDLGTYPAEYTSLHYVSVDYLLDQLSLTAAALVGECEAVHEDFQSDSHIVSMLVTIRERERDAAARIQELQSECAT